MAEVGILNLQIKDNSEEAAKGLIDLGNAFLVLKNAVGEGIKLSGVATQIKRLAKVVDESLGTGTIATIERFCNSISKLNGLGNININLKGADKISRTIESIETGKAAIQGMSDGFSTLGERVSRTNAEAERFSSTVREVNELMRNTTWSWGSGGFEQFQQMLDVLFRARSMALGAGDPFASWKEGAIEVEGTVKDASEGIAGYLGEPIKYLTDTASQLGNLNDYLERTDALYEKMAEDTAAVSGAHAIIPFNQIGYAVELATKKRLEYTDAIARQKQAEYEAATATRKAQEAAFYGGNGKPQFSMWQTNQMADNLSQLDLLLAKLRDAQIKYNEFVNKFGAGSTKAIKAGLDVQKLNDQIWEYQQSLRAATEESTETENASESLRQRFEELMFGAEGLGGAMKRLFPSITGLLKRFQNLVKYRMLRAIIKHITDGFREGVQNVYQYSKAVGTSLAPAMDSASSALLQMKNSIGAAAAPLIQAFIPYIKMAVSAVIEAVNWLNQFFALLRGQSTWTRALPVATEAFKDQTKAAKGTSAAMKDLLADWDELNIIQSQSGGGGSGASAKDATDYATMFEEVNKFDESIKDAIKFIEDHLGGIPGILKKAGAILLGWKLSKAFGGLIGALGKIIAGGALVTLGVELSYGGGFEAGSKGYFDAKDLIATIGGAVAAALGGSMITSAIGLGGGIGFAIGLTGAIVLTLIGWIKGQEDLKDKSKWGNLSMTQEQIRNFVKDQFTFDADAEVQVMSAHISNIEDAKKRVNEAISNFNSSFTDAEKIVADVDTTAAEQKIAAVKQAALDTKETIDAVQQLIDANEEGLTYTLTNFKFENAGGEDITEDLLNSIKISDKTLSEFFTGQGQKIAQLMLDGEKSGWKNGEMEAALELMASQKRIYDRAAQLQEQLKFETNMSSQIKNVVDRETATKLYAQQKEELKGYEDTVRKTIKEEADGLLELAALAQASAEEVGIDTDVGKELKKTADDYTASATRILDGMDSAVEDRLAKTKERMAKEWAETLRVVYGEDFETISKELTGTAKFDVDAYETLLNPFGDSYTLNPENIKTHGIQETADKLREALLYQITSSSNDPNGLISAYINDFNGNLFDLMSEESKRNLAASLVTAAGDSAMATEIFQKLFGLPSSRDVDKYFTGLNERVAGDLREVYGENFDKIMNDLTGTAKFDVDALDALLNPFGDSYTLNPQNINTHGIQETADKLREALMYQLMSPANDPKGLVKSYFNDFKGNLFDLMSEEAKRNLALNLVKASGNSVTATEIFQKMFGLPSFRDVEKYFSDIDEKINEAAKGSDYAQESVTIAAEIVPEQESITVDAEVNIGETQLYEQLKKEVEDAMKDGIMSTDEAFDLMTRYGWQEYENALKELQYNLDEYGGNRGMVQPMGMLASAGTSDVGFARKNFTPDSTVTLQVEPGDNQQEVNNTANGVRQGTETLLSALNSILSVAQAINRKQFVVNLVPTSGLGRTVAQGAAAFSRVTGVDR